MTNTWVDQLQMDVLALGDPKLAYAILSIAREVYSGEKRFNALYDLVVKLQQDINDLQDQVNLYKRIDRLEQTLKE